MDHILRKRLAIYGLGIFNHSPSRWNKPFGIYRIGGGRIADRIFYATREERNAIAEGLLRYDPPAVVPVLRKPKRKLTARETVTKHHIGIRRKLARQRRENVRKRQARLT